MLATIDQPAETKTSSLTKTTFDEENRVIQATVIISQERGKFRHRVSPLSAVGPAGSYWTVIWTLEASEGISANFVKNGIIISPSPPGGIHKPQPTKISETQAQLTFTNNVTDVNVIRYKFDVHAESESGKLQEHLIIDPTIAVVKDPVDG
jgi:hypothetical protein